MEKPQLKSQNDLKTRAYQFSLTILQLVGSFSKTCAIIEYERDKICGKLKAVKSLAEI